MPKRSKEDTEITIKVITEAVVEQILTIGYDRMSYTTLSDQTGISRTGISHHFPKKVDFVETVSDEIVSIFHEYLDFSHGINGLKTSWKCALNDKRFVALTRLLMHHILLSEGSKPFAHKILNMLYSMVNESLGDDGYDVLESLLGHSLVVISE